MHTLKEYIKSWEENKDFSKKSFWLMFGSFLDDFYFHKDKKILEEEPFTDEKVPIELRAFIAASVDYLSNMIKEKSPDWIYNDNYYLKSPYFITELKGDIRVIMFLESPIEFKIRNIFVQRNVLSRC